MVQDPRLHVYPPPQQGGKPNPEYRALSELASGARRRWLMPGFVPLGAITAVVGRPKVGKSLFLAALAASATAGVLLPGRRKAKPLGSAFWLTREDDMVMDVRPRLEAAGADVGQVLCPVLNDSPEAAWLTGLAGLQQLEYYATVCAMRLVIIDPLASFLPPGASMSDESVVRPILERLAALARMHELAVIVSQHRRKRAAEDPLDEGIGSVCIAAVCRSVLRLRRHPAGDGLHVVEQVGVNVGAAPRPLLYAVEASELAARLVWRGQLAGDDDQGGDDLGDAGELDARREARELLLRLLRDGPRSVKFIGVQAHANKISDSTLRRAKAELGVRSRHVGTGEGQRWEWYLPGGPAKK